MEVRRSIKYDELRNQYGTVRTIKIKDGRVCIFTGVMTFTRYKRDVDHKEVGRISI